MRFHLLLTALAVAAVSGAQDSPVAARDADPMSWGDIAGKVGRDAKLIARRNLLERRDATGRCPTGQSPVSNGQAFTPNGCGPEKFEGLVPELWFNACCNAHDGCYVDCSKSKDQCDNEFYTCMRAACDVEFAGFWKTLARYSCQTKAGVYFTAVKLGGQSSFEGGTAEACNCV